MAHAANDSPSSFNIAWISQGSQDGCDTAIVAEVMVDGCPLCMLEHCFQTCIAGCKVLTLLILKVQAPQFILGRVAKLTDGQSDALAHLDVTQQVGFWLRMHYLFGSPSIFLHPRWVRVAWKSTPWPTYRF